MRNDLVAKGVRSLIAEAQLDPAFERSFMRTCIACAAKLCGAFSAWLHARAIPKDLDEDALAHVIHGAFWYRFLSGTKYPYDDAYARNIVELLRPGIQPIDLNITSTSS